MVLPAPAADLFFSAAVAGRLFTRDQATCEKAMSANGERINTNARATEITLCEWRARAKTIEKEMMTKRAMREVLPMTAIKPRPDKRPGRYMRTPSSATNTAKRNAQRAS